MSISLPKPIVEYFAAEKACDAARLPGCFASDGGARASGATVLPTARTAPGDSSCVELAAADVATADGCRTVIDAVHRRLGGIDVIGHVVGGSSAPAGGFAVLDDREWQRALDVNLLAAVRLDRGLLPVMLEQRSGVIIHITSIQSR